jgi:hypothetical protein
MELACVPKKLTSLCDTDGDVLHHLPHVLSPLDTLVRFRLPGYSFRPNHRRLEHQLTLGLPFFSSSATIDVGDVHILRD